MIENIKYICAYINKNNNKIIISYVYLTQLNGNSDIAGTTHNNIINNDNSDYVILFNTNINIHKILCYNIKEKDEIKCYKIEFKNNEFKSFDLFIDFKAPLNKNNCYFTWFYSEYLICCSGQDIISCYRLNDNYEIINKFELNIYGYNYNLTIIDNEDYASLFYINENVYSSYLHLFEYTNFE